MKLSEKIFKMIKKYQKKARKQIKNMTKQK